MKKNYDIYGEKKVIDGKVYYSQDCCSDGFEYGFVFKDEKAFNEQPDEVCYIPESSFEDVDPIVVDGEKFYSADELNTYTRRQLEEMLKDDDGQPFMDEDDEPIDIEYFFNSLFWCCPETKLEEIAY